MKKFIPVFILAILMISVAALAQGTKKVAVIPFGINSKEDIEYIRDGVMDMLMSRISVDGRIEVLSRTEITEHLGKSKKKGFTQSDAQSLGKRLNADFVVWGSITKIGNSMSIDGKLIDIAENKSPVSFFVQSKGMDEVVTQVNDFAKRIDKHILGRVPSGFESSSSAAVSPAADTVQDKQEAVSLNREPQPTDALKSKKGTLTATINPEFIHNSPTPISAPQSRSKTGFWMSEKINAKIIGMSIGDVNNDGKNEIVMIDQNNIMIYLKVDKSLKRIQKIAGKSYDQYLSVDVADINGTGTKQIIVTSINQGILDSFVLEYKDGKFVKIASDLPWLLRVIYVSEKPLLIGQMIGTAEPFMTPICELGWRDGKYKEVKKMKIPVGLSVYDFIIESLDKEGDRIITMDQFDYIRVFEESDKALESLIQYFSVKEMLWKSDEKYGGSCNRFETLQTILSKQEPKPPLPYVNIRMLSCDLYNQGKKDLIVVRNHSAVGRVLQDVKLFTSSEIVDLEWTGIGFSEAWKSKKINGYISDIQLKDIDNDGKDELVLSLLVTSSAAMSPKSVIVSYTLDTTKKPESEGLTIQ
jgi:TolB-like protein